MINGNFLPAIRVTVIL